MNASSTPLVVSKANGLKRDYHFSWLQRLAIRIIKQGRIPCHVAVIMDGNRRFARKKNSKVIEGHKSGFGKLFDVLHWSNELGIHEITTYAFAIENFKRRPDEVDGLMALAEIELRQMLSSPKTLQEDNVCIRFLGNTTYLPVSLQQVCAELTLATKHFRGTKLNIALSYSAREEICTAVNLLVFGANEGIVHEGHFNEQLLSLAMYSSGSPDPDLLLRTSGEVRLSDFLLWQTCMTVTEFLPPLWPDLSLWNFLAAIMHYQWQACKIVHRADRSSNKDQVQGVSAHEGSMREIQFKMFVDRRRSDQLREDSLGNAKQAVFTTEDNI